MALLQCDRLFTSLGLSLIDPGENGGPSVAPQHVHMQQGAQ
jgi:hypothetical protein